MRFCIILAGIVLTCAHTSAMPVQQETSCSVDLEQLAEELFLDTTQLPADFDRNTLLRLYDFLKANVIPDDYSPYPQHMGQLPVIVRYVPFSCAGQFPVTTQGFAGWCDVVNMECLSAAPQSCHLSVAGQTTGEAAAFLALVAIPQADAADYRVQLWGFTAHEIAHSLGAIDGPRYPGYEDDKRLAPVRPASDTYYWFGISSLFEQGWQGVVWDAFADTCADSVCAALRKDVFLLD